MTNAEFSQEMDVIYENINKDGAVGLDEYEKSVILTNAQEKLVYELSATGDLSLLAHLVKNTKSVPTSTGATDPLLIKLDPNSTIFTLPSNYVRIMAEKVISLAEDPAHPGQPISPEVELAHITVFPITLQQHAIFTSKPYRFPKKRTCWRIMQGDTGMDRETTPAEVINSNVEIIGPSGAILGYYVNQVLTQPKPIILEDLTAAGLQIRGIATETETNMLESLHPAILDYAVNLAERYYFDKYGVAPQQAAK